MVFDTAASGRQLAQRAHELFAKSFADDPRTLVAAPGRVNLIGGHVDYNDGVVLPLAIDRHTVLAGRLTQNGIARIVSSQVPGTELKIALNQTLEPQQGGWGDYLRGVLAGFRARGHHIPGLEAVVVSNIPIGSGLSSSAALLVGLSNLAGRPVAGVPGPSRKSVALPSCRASLCRCSLRDHGSLYVRFWSSESLAEDRLPIAPCGLDSLGFPASIDPDPRYAHPSPIGRESVCGASQMLWASRQETGVSLLSRCHSRITGPAPITVGRLRMALRTARRQRAATLSDSRAGDSRPGLGSVWAADVGWPSFAPR